MLRDLIHNTLTAQRMTSYTPSVAFKVIYTVVGAFDKQKRLMEVYGFHSVLCYALCNFYSFCACVCCFDNVHIFIGF